MISVTSVRTEIAIAVIEGGIFDPGEAAILKLAYDRASRVLGAEYPLNDQAKTKLARIVLRIGRVRMVAIHGLRCDPDVQAIAAAAIAHVLASGDDLPKSRSALTPLFLSRSVLPDGARRVGGDDATGADTAAEAVKGA